MAIIDLGKVSITWRGAYDEPTAYTQKTQLFITMRHTFVLQTQQEIYQQIHLIGMSWR